MNDNIAHLVKFQPELDSSTTSEGVELLRQLACNPAALQRLILLAEKGSQIERLVTKCGTIEESCRTLSNRCDAADMLLGQVVCPGNVNYSQRTLDEYSDNAQVNLEVIQTGLGAPFVNAYPVPPANKIRLTHAARPGYNPTRIAIDLNVAGGGNNYLDFVLQFYLVPGGAPTSTGLEIGSQMRGNQFLNKDGTQIHVPFPEYRGMGVDIGSLESLALVISNTGAANNLDSAFVTVYYDNKAFYAACKKKCGC